MIRICVVCEGHTEVEFVKSCLAPFLFRQDNKVSVFPVLLQSRAGNQRGGRVTVERLVNLISKQYHHADRITTLVDFYGFQDRKGRTSQEVAQAVHEGIGKKIKNYDMQRVLPYLQMHEFEGLLFTDPDAFEWVTDGWSAVTREQLHAIAAEFTNPEDINDSPETAPSKRILEIFPAGTYSKVEHGPLIAETIGMDAIREKCPLFNEWVSMLENWGNA
ncbi:MAG: DUF4276 family protein [Desulfovibrionales bacterium]|nr:DUF4276 family protein [Desulfovibrionales bacterium]